MSMIFFSEKPFFFKVWLEIQNLLIYLPNAGFKQTNKQINDCYERPSLWAQVQINQPTNQHNQSSNVRASSSFSFSFTSQATSQSPTHIAHTSILDDCSLSLANFLWLITSNNIFSLSPSLDDSLFVHEPSIMPITKCVSVCGCVRVIYHHHNHAHSHTHTRPSPPFTAMNTNPVKICFSFSFLDEFWFLFEFQLKNASI